MVWFSKIKGVAHFLIEDIDGKRKIQKKKFDVTKTHFSYKNNDYIINLTKAIREKNNKYVLYYKIGKSEPLTFDDSKCVTDSTMLKTVLDNKILSQLLGSHNELLFMIIIMVMAIAMIVLTFTLLRFIPPEIVGNVTSTAPITTEPTIPIQKPPP